LCRLNLFKIHIKVLKIKESPIHPPLGPSILAPGLSPLAISLSTCLCSCELHKVGRKGKNFGMKLRTSI
jgi:hypothetical protein